MIESLETSSTQRPPGINTSSSTDMTSFSWANMETYEQAGIVGWYQKLAQAWEDQRYDDAIVHLDDYLDRIVPLFNDVLLAAGHLSKAHCHLAMGRYEQALDLVEQAEGKLDSHKSTIDDLLRKTSFDEAKRYLNQYKGLLLLNLGRDEEALQLLKDNPPNCTYASDIYRDIEAKLGIELFDSREISMSSSSYYSATSPSEYTGAEKDIYDKLIGDWLKK